MSLCHVDSLCSFVSASHVHLCHKQCGKLMARTRANSHIHTITYARTHSLTYTYMYIEGFQSVSKSKDVFFSVHIIFQVFPFSLTLTVFFIFFFFFLSFFLLLLLIFVVVKIHEHEWQRVLSYNLCTMRYACVIKCTTTQVREGKKNDDNHHNNNNNHQKY